MFQEVITGKKKLGGGEARWGGGREEETGNFCPWFFL